MGRIFSYQEKTGMSYFEILRMPYIVFIIGMADAPSVDYDTKKEKQADTPETAQDEVLHFVNAFQ